MTSLRLALFFLISSLVLLTGCSQVPQAMNHQYSAQKKMQAVKHWEILAHDVAEQLSANTQKRVISVANPTPEASPFQRGFHDLLVTRLVHNGIAVSSQPGENIPSFSYTLQTVRHMSPRTSRPLPGTFASIAGGIVVARDVVRYSRNVKSVVAGVGTGVAIDLIWDSFPSPTDHELLITTNLTLNGHYIYRRNDIYYINGVDAWHYRDTAPTRQPTTFAITE